MGTRSRKTGAAMLMFLCCACSASSKSSINAEDDWQDWESGCADDVEFDLATGATWQWQLTDAIDITADVQVYDVDLFNVSVDIMDALHADENPRFVICYFSAGTYEGFRDDAGDFDTDDFGNVVEGWEDERWIDVTSSQVRDIMVARLDRAAQLGCDGVEPDNLDAYANDTGLAITPLDQLEYNRFIAEKAHDRNLSVGLKNDVEQIEQLAACFDWALNEECLVYDECESYAPFLDAGKAVFHVEYVDSVDEGPARAAEVCGDPRIEGFSTLIKEWDLSAWGIPCSTD